LLSFKSLLRIPVFVLVGLLLLTACSDPQKAGDVKGPELPAAVLSAKQLAQNDLGANRASNKQVLFGDLHVHTTFSPDAFIIAMPAAGGQGLTPPAAACDYARYCSALDFWSINDHAEGVTPRRWSETKKLIRQCNAVSGDPANPDMVAFLGWEWSQVNTDRNKHYGHKNVIFRDTADDKVPARSIAAPRKLLNEAPMGRAAQLMLGLNDFENRDYYMGIDTYYKEIGDTPICEKNINTRDLPTDCLEVADDPKELFGKLNEWGFDTLVIPHGNSWGMNTPPGTSFDKQLNSQQHDPRLQTLFEVYSGHGNSEEYRNWRSVNVDDKGNQSCPEATADYLPCCQQAGRIIEQRCLTEGVAGSTDASECSSRAADARQNFIDAGISGHLTVPGQQVSDWLNCGLCPNCFAEPMDHRPKTTAQYALAITNFDNPKKPLRFRFGFIGSSDNHGAAPGTGYKELDRDRLVDGLMLQNEKMAARMMRDSREPAAKSMPAAEIGQYGLNMQRNMERQASFWMTGGLVAVHSEGRDRDAIWDAMSAKNVYGTSGDRTLMWFDEITDESVPKPMGSEFSLVTNPRFRVQAAGAFEQLPGCPSYAEEAMGVDALEQLCGGECYNPSNTRKAIERIEIVRIRPQIEAGEDVGSLIEDPWKTFQCDDAQSLCSVEFEDAEFLSSGRENVYYARAIQAQSDAINGGGVRCEFDEAGRCIKVNPCYGDNRTDQSDDCLAPLGERAWSSPIFIEQGAY